MRQSISTLLAIAFVLISATACTNAQQTASASGAANQQEMRQHSSSGGMPQGERPTGEMPSGSKRGTGEAKAGKNETGLSNESSDSDVKTVMGTVKSIVGNEVVLIVAQKSNASAESTNQGKSANTTGGSSQAGSVNQQSDSATGTKAVDNSDTSAESSAQEETETYLIPVGMSIGNKDFTSIKAGNTLKIYFGTDSNDGSEMITAVELR